jgi:hypothetical protein
VRDAKDTTEDLHCNFSPQEGEDAARDWGGSLVVAWKNALHF